MSNTKNHTNNYFSVPSFYSALLSGSGSSRVLARMGVEVNEEKLVI